MFVFSQYVIEFIGRFVCVCVCVCLLKGFLIPITVTFSSLCVYLFFCVYVSVCL